MLLGIDFGTSFSQVSTMDLGQPSLLLNPGEYGVPSEFYFDRDIGILVGQDALDAGQGVAAANLVTGVKMSIISGASFTLDGRRFTAKDIVKEICKSLVSTARHVARKRFMDNNIEGVVVSVPAKFGIQERHLIAEAVKECMNPERLPIKAIIKEPVAAAIAYYYKNQVADNSHILVYDLGGGTCDIALVRADSSMEERFAVVDSDMVRIGGRNWDEKLCDYIAEILECKTGARTRGNAGFEEKIRRAAISVKHDLSNPAKDRSMARVELNGTIYTIPISRSVFDEITLPLLWQTFDCLQDVYERNALSCRIDEIICVGGSSNMLQVEEGLLRRFPQCRIRLYEPEHAVVNGATIYAYMPHETLTDVASFSYGTATNTHYGFPDNKKIVSNIIKRGARLPAVCSRSYHPARAEQEGVVFNIFESEFLDEDFDMSNPEKRLVGTVRLLLPPNSPKDIYLRCKLRLNVNGLLDVEASEPSGRKVAATFNIRTL